MAACARNHYLEETIVHWKHIAPIIHEPQNHAEYEKLADMLDQLLDIVGDNESHELMGLVDVISHMISMYDECHHKPLQQASGIDALKFLIEERGVKSIGHETFDTDASIDTAKNGDIVGERYILGQDTFQVELLTNLDQLPTRGAIIYAISPKPKDAPGFPVRAFAIKP